MVCLYSVLYVRHFTLMTLANDPVDLRMCSSLDTEPDFTYKFIIRSSHNEFVEDARFLVYDAALRNEQIPEFCRILGCYVA